MQIELKNITKSYNGQTVIPPVNLTIKNGSFTSLLGPSGCGKTTLLRMIAGLETPDAGEIYFDGTCVFSAGQNINLPPEKRGLGFVFQDFALWPHLTVFENVAFGLRARGITENLDAQVNNALKSVQLEDFAGRYPHQLSGGQQQRVAFARAIVIHPHCILFDEPLSALDAILRESMRQEIKELVNRLNITAVFVTHDQLEAISMSDAIAVINKGHIEQYASPEEIYNKPATQFAAHFVGKSNWLDSSTMFRPESLSLTEQPDSVSCNVSVAAVQYTGSAYEITLNYKNYKWLMHASKKLLVGTSLTIYIEKNKILSL